MDLRIVKTKKLIRESFLTLRRSQPLSRIKVVELCSLAMINKTTFYKYYTDVYDLSDELDREVFERFRRNFTAGDCLLSDTARFIRELPQALDAVGDLLVPQFHDRYDDFFSMLERELIAGYAPPEMEKGQRIRLCFAICGLVHMLKTVKLDGSCTVDDLAAEAPRYFPQKHA